MDAMPDQRDILEAMQIAVPRSANRIASFTNKAAAYYCAQTHAATHPEYAWYEGLNVAKNRVFGGYNLYVSGQRLDNQAAAATVYPHKLVRQHGPALREELWLFDDRNLLEIDLGDATQLVGLQLKGEGVRFVHQQEGVAFFSAQEGKFVLAVAPRQPGTLERQGERVITASTGFFISCGQDEAEATALVHEGQQHSPALKLARQQRLREFLQANAYLEASDDSLALALRWLALTTDQLVTRQQGDGIYAGLPWFNEYWGRDEFIALPGAVLVTGQFATARRILESFAKFQQLDPASKYYGRMPNIINPSTIDYHTTDGTPRFVIALRDYVQYSGDMDLGWQLYPAVQASIEGALQNWVDEKGYLLHEDNETWMDARDANHVAYTPRSTRANDIQALWYQQLQAGAYFAAYVHDGTNQAKWTQLAEQVKQHVGQDYRRPTHDYLADRLDQQDRPDFTLRPNQLFALDLVADSAFTRQALRRAWQELVYPWGVATLARQDPQFHPYHLAPERYHKDAAYHRGTVWPWLNGIAMQRMLEAGQTEPAYQLFANANRQALTLGVVGGLSENLDAYPHPGQAWPKLTGAYLQAWSNAEQLRVWYQYFLGIRPDVPNQQLTLAPRLPAALQHLNYRFCLGAGSVTAQYQAGPSRMYSYAFQGVATQVQVDVFPFGPTTVAVQPGHLLKVTAAAQQLTIEVFDQSRLVSMATTAPSAARLAQQAQDDAVLAGVAFAEPLPLSSYVVMGVVE
jgi:glycogen debranching enzyme